MGHKGMTMSQEISMGRHLVTHVIRGQNRGSTPIEEPKGIKPIGESWSKRGTHE